MSIHFREDYALRYASENGNLEVVKCADWCQYTCRNDESLIRSSQYGHLDVLKYLVEKGANIHTDNNFALRCASEDGRLHIIKFLIEKGADIHVWKDISLRWARLKCHHDVVDFLENVETPRHSLIRFLRSIPLIIKKLHCLKIEIIISVI